jgi:hypothetical protein
MIKIIVSCLFIACFVAKPSHAHVQHYNHLNLIKFDIFRNDSKVGFHSISFERDKGKLIVRNLINFEIKKLGISFYKYESEGTEIYTEEGNLLSFESKTSEDGDIKYCSIKKQGDYYVVDGEKFKGEVKKNFLLSSYWNHELLKQTTQIAGITCAVREQKVNFIKDETIKVLGVDTETAVFEIKGEDLDTQVWYRKKDWVIVQQVLNTRGVWLYTIDELN